MDKKQTPLATKQEFDQGSGAGKAAVALFDSVELIVFTVVAVFLLLSCALRVCVVSGPSMNNTLLDGEKLLVSDLFYTPSEGDIIIFHQTSETDDKFNEPIVKRVIATGGKYVKIDYVAKQIYVSQDDVFTAEEILHEDYILQGKPQYLAGENKDIYIYEVPEGHLFVMGDNRPVSADSRYREVEFVDQRRVLGKVLCRITPLSKFGKVD